MTELFSTAGLRDFLIYAGICIAGAAAAAVALLVIAAYQIAELEVPEDADFFETMQHIPITVPIALDLLDLAFDIFAAPMAWFILELLGLPALQTITVFEGLIPGTQLIPTLTIGWVIARLMKNKRATPARKALAEHELERRRARYGQIRGDRQAVVEHYRRKSLQPGTASAGEQEVVEGEYYSGEDRDYRTEQRRRYEEDMDAPLEYFDEEGEL